APRAGSALRRHREDRERLLLRTRSEVPCPLDGLTAACRSRRVAGILAPAFGTAGAKDSHPRTSETPLKESLTHATIANDPPPRRRVSRRQPRGRTPLGAARGAGLLSGPDGRLHRRTVRGRMPTALGEYVLSRLGLRSGDRSLRRRRGLRQRKRRDRRA